MTIENNYETVKELGNGVTVQFSFDWNAITETYLQVLLEDVVTGVQTEQTLNVDYTVTLTDTNGFVTFAVAPTSANYAIVARDVPESQEVPFSENNSYRGTTHENSYDKVWARLQENSDGIDRSLIFPLGTDTDVISNKVPVPEIDLILGWNSTATALENKTVTAGEVLPAVSDTYIKRKSDNTGYEPKTVTEVATETFATKTTDNLTEGSNNLYNKLSIGYRDGGVISTQEDLFVAMTSNTAPSGEEAWSDLQNSGANEPWMVFNKSTSNETLSASKASVPAPNINLRAMSSLTPIRAIQLTNSSTNARNPLDFTLVYTTDDMSVYSNEDNGIRSANFTPVKTVVSEVWTGQETKEYSLDTPIPTNATAWGIVATDVSNTTLGLKLTEMNGFDLSSKQTGVTDRVGRSQDNTEDLSFNSDILDITDSGDFAGTPPSLTSTRIYIWNEYNGGTNRPILDDSVGTNLDDAGKSERVGYFDTDASDNIIAGSQVQDISSPFKEFVENDGGIFAYASFTGSTGAVLKSKNISSFTRDAQGLYTVIMDKEASSVNYTILCVAESPDSGSSNRVLNVFNGVTKTKTTFGLIGENSSGANVDPVNNGYLIVIGGN